MGLVRTAPPAALITLATAKLHLRVDTDLTADDALITTYAAAAVDRVESYLQRAILTQTWEIRIDRFPSVHSIWHARPAIAREWPSYETLCTNEQLIIRLPRPTLISVESIKYLDPSNTLVTLDPSAYVVDLTGLPGSVSPAYGTNWPATLPVPNAVRIAFTCGFGADATAVPQSIVAACLLELGDLYTRREPGPDLGDTATCLLGGYLYREVA